MNFTYSKDVDSLAPVDRSVFAATLGMDLNYAVINDITEFRQIDRLPANLGEAIDHLRKNQVLLDALGSDLAQAFVAVRRAEWEAMQNFSCMKRLNCCLSGIRCR